jgi:hypothetical protein
MVAPPLKDVGSTFLSFCGGLMVFLYRLWNYNMTSSEVRADCPGSGSVEVMAAIVVRLQVEDGRNWS